jgi:hypothetical protein
MWASGITSYSKFKCLPFLQNNRGYRQYHSIELHQPLDESGMCPNLTVPNPGYHQSHLTELHQLPGEAGCFPRPGLTLNMVSQT